MTAPEAKLLVGLIGAGIQLSLTPALQEEEARHHGLRLHYQLIDWEQTPGAMAQWPSLLPTLLTAARVMGYAGLNITYPCKQAVVPLLDELSDEAAVMGAVNTVVIGNGRLVGHNTDGPGWVWGLRRTLPDADLGCVVLLGAGGAGSAIAHAALSLDAQRLRIVDTDAARSQALTAALNARYGGRAEAFTDVALACRGATGLIHATPTGMAHLPGLPLDAALLHPNLWVSEAVYFPRETELLATARALGCAVVDGGAMAVGQAVGAFELFTGRAANAGRMAQHFERLVAGR